MRVRGRPMSDDGDGAGGDGTGDGDGGDPFERLDADPLEEGGDLFDAGAPADPFEEMDTPEIDGESVWDAVLTADEGDDGAAGEEGADAVVPKDRYCLTCEHFAAPPEMACTHPGTAIEELVGVDRVKLRNCPVVARRRRAETALPTGDGAGTDPDPDLDSDSDSA